MKIKILSPFVCDGTSYRKGKVVDVDGWDIKSLVDHRLIEVIEEVNEVIEEVNEETDEVNYDDMSLKELKSLLKGKGLSQVGKKEELIARLTERVE